MLMPPAADAELPPLRRADETSAAARHAAEAPLTPSLFELLAAMIERQPR